jgi:hypothetical protein
MATMSPTHLEPLSLGQIGSVPWSFSPVWFLLIGLGVPALIWLGLAWKRALDEDPHRVRRTGLRQLRRHLVRIKRSGSAPAPLHLHGWCGAAARAWGVDASTPTTGEVTQSIRALTADDPVITKTWRELWLVTERGLYAAGITPPPDWLDRASAAAAKVQVPKRERWLPNRLAHWLPSITTAVLLASAILIGLLAGPTVDAGPAQHPATAEDQKAAVTALHQHWNDWAAHYNVAAAQIQERNWNYAVAHATAAFLLDPSQAANRDNLRFSIQQAGTMDPTLRRLLYGAWFQRFPTLLSPAEWQHLALFASVLLAGGLTALVATIYLPGKPRPLILGGRTALLAGCAMFVLALTAYDTYGALSRPTAGILLGDANLSPSPTELVPEQETFPATAGSVTLPHTLFLGWEQVSVGTNISGWVRSNAVMPFYQTPRR